MSHPVNQPTVLMGQIVLVDSFASALPLEHTDVTAQVSGPLASVAVTQRFGNPLEAAAELEYLFPLPHEGAITAFELRLGERVIRADLHEIEVARKKFEEARDEGKRAGLLEQRRPNLFGVRLTNVQPGETVLTTVRYQQRVKFDADGYEFVYPMGLTPRYTQPGYPQEGQEVSAPVAQPGEKIGPVEISLSVDAGVQAGEPTSPSHPIETTRLDERRFQVRLAGDQIPDRDFVLRYTVSGADIRPAAWTSEHKDGNFFLATLIPPTPETDVEVPPREFIFVLDRSGSMNGGPIMQARNALRACLRVLGTEDNFRILLFDHELEWYQAEPSKVTQADVDSADAFLACVDARGGTEIISALKAALTIPADPRRTRLVVFLTDGAVSAEGRALENLVADLGNARVFTFGIGPSVNRALLGKMASLGRGAAEFLQAEEDIEGAIIRFQDRVSMPVLTDLSIEWKNGKAWDVYPSLLPDLYIGQPLEICGRVKATWGKPPKVIIRGKRAGQAVEFALELPGASAVDASIGRAWARARVDDLLDRMMLEPKESESLRASVISVALEFGLVTPFTAFVVVDEHITDGGKPTLVRVAQPLPAGLDFGGFAPPPSAMPMAASLKSMASPRMRYTGGRVMRSMAADASQVDGFAAPLVRESAPMQDAAPVAPRTREEVLRWLGRTQRVDGSWEGSLEFTAAAVLAFVRAGYTTRSGPFRVVVKRAAQWLVQVRGDGWEAFLRWRALNELALTTGESGWTQQADELRAQLPVPQGTLEEAALDGKTTGPLGGLDGLRLAALATKPSPVALAEPAEDLWRVWHAATLPK
ncbi:MAG: VWA domain-containing protein [Anaerolineaceae bacterium]|nr:VWA domain-containing protein [Anaerolineaceae bacterium]